jgi:hypothetical protein
MRSTISTTPREWPCAVSTTSTSAPASTSACARSSASGPTPTAAVRVLRRLRELDALLDVLHRDQALQPAVAVDDRQLLDAVAVQQLLGLRERRADGRRHEVARGHERGHGLREVLLEAEVAVREDADEAAVGVRDRHPADVVVLHQPDRV